MVRPERLIEALSSASRIVGAWIGLSPASRSFQVIGNRGQRLVDSVRQRDAISPIAVNREICTSSDCNSCNLCFGLPPLGQVANEPGKKALIARIHLTHRQPGKVELPSGR